MRPAQEQQGVVLVLTMIVVAVLMILILSFTSSAILERSYTHRSLHEIQAMEAAKSAILHGMLYLGEDARRDDRRGERYDAEAELWTAPQIMTFNEADVVVTIEDENRHFNLYPLLSGKRPGPKDARRIQYRRFLDAIQQSQSGGAGDDVDARIDRLIEYVFVQRGVPLWTKDEMVLVDDSEAILDSLSLDDDTANQLEAARDNMLTLYPARRTTQKININTAPFEVLMSVSSLMTQEAAEQIVTERDAGDSPFLSLSDLKKRLVTMKMELAPNRTLFDELAPYLTVSSSYFTITAEARYKSVRCRLRARVYRAGEKVTLVWVETVQVKQGMTHTGPQASRLNPAEPGQGSE